MSGETKQVYLIVYYIKFFLLFELTLSESRLDLNIWRLIFVHYLMYSIASSYWPVDCETSFYICEAKPFPSQGWTPRWSC
jgi:hypothetical protein